MKTSIKYISIFFVILLIGFVAYVGYVVWAVDSFFGEISNDTWSIENQIILNEIYSPDSTKKVGFYHYNSGVFGYTTVCVSLVQENEQYPISPNILKVADWAIDSLIWENNQELMLQVKPGYGGNKKIGTVPKSLNISDVQIRFEATNK